jgi:prephenate dehydrogenase
VALERIEGDAGRMSHPHVFPPLSETRVAVVGLGLMGGSLAAALSVRRACAEVIGVARRQAVLNEARGRGWICAGGTDTADGVREAQLVILATPPRVILEQIATMGPMLAPGAVLMDLGSTKQLITEAMQALPEHVHPVGGHPMCGKEQAGLSAATPDLFVGRPFVLTPLDRTPIGALQLVHELVEAVGARPLIMDPIVHDRRVAWTSHAPHLAAIALVQAVVAEGERDPGVLELIAGGFRDTTRLAASDVTMMLDMFLTNREPLLHAAQQFQAELLDLCSLLEKNDESALRRRLVEVSRRRREVS